MTTLFGTANGVSTRSRPKAADRASALSVLVRLFQHAAARRRLIPIIRILSCPNSFNTQPPEGGCSDLIAHFAALSFQHAAARRRLIRQMR